MCPEPTVTIIKPEPKFYERAAIYCRVSSNSQEQLNSMANQVSALTQFVCRQLGWHLVDIYLDIHSGRSVAARPQFMRMMADCEQKKIDRIVTKTMSRFGRNTVEGLDAINKLRANGIDVYFENEDMHSRDGKNAFMISILQGLAQEESLARSQNIKWGILRGVEDGTSKIYSRKCYGYVNDQAGELVIHEAEAEIVKLIYLLYLSGYSILGIRSELQKRQIKSPTGREEWNKRTIDLILTNEKYTGDVMVMKTYSEEFPKRKRKVNQGEFPAYVSSGATPVIIPKDLFDQVAAMRAERSNIVRDENGNTRKSTRYNMKKAISEDENASNVE